MTATSTRRAGPSSTTRSLGTLPGIAQARRSMPMALIGLLSLVIGAVVAAGLFLGGDDRQAVLVVARPVAAGQVIAAGDLAVAEASLSGAEALPASERSEVVGKTAAVGLAPGTVLAPSQLGARSGLGRGEAVVGVAVKAGQAPAGLRAGTRVRVVDTGGTAGVPPAAVVSNSAVVTDVDRTDTGTVVASLRVPEGDAVAVAAAGAAGRASLVVLPAP
ncbi:MAG: SAF domain-containing protein [Acidimicrobiia bacterium]